MKRTIVSLLLAASYSASINAAVFINIVEDGPNVVASVSGSVDTNAYPPYSTADATGSWIRGSSGGFLSGFGFGGGALVNAFRLNPTSAVFSTGTNYQLPGTGPLFGVYIDSSDTDVFYIAQDYESGSALSSTATAANQSFASMGLIEGEYEFSWGGGDIPRDTATLIIGGALPPTPVREYSGTLPSGATGSLSFSTDDPGCEFDGEPQFQSTDHIFLPPWLQPIDGVVDFTLGSCTPGATVTFTMDYGAAIPEGAKYWKVGEEFWREIPSTITGNQVEFTLTDGGIFDDDGVANGRIVDPSGAATGSAPGATQSRAIPTMSVYGLVWTALALLVVAGRRLTIKRK